MVNSWKMELSLKLIALKWKDERHRILIGIDDRSATIRPVEGIKERKGGNGKNGADCRNQKSIWLVNAIYRPRRA